MNTHDSQSRYLAHPGLALAHGLPSFHSLPQSPLPFIRKIKQITDSKVTTVQRNRKVVGKHRDDR